VVDGTVVVHRDGEVLAHLGPGSHFGERGLLNAAPRNATVTTEDAVEVLRVDGDVLMEALGSAPAMRTALERLRPTEAVLLERRPVVDDPRWAKA
jgi:CRP-like cAMP-binding protein